MGLPGTSPFALHGAAGETAAAGPGVIRPQPAPIGKAPLSRSRPIPAVQVYVESGSRTGEFVPQDRVDWRSIVRARDGADTTATIVAMLDITRLADEHFSEVLTRLNPDRRVRIASRGIVLFQGYPQSQTVIWNENEQSVQILCLDEAQEMLRTAPEAQITGRWMRLDPLRTWDAGDLLADEISAELPVFNAGGFPNRSRESFPVVGQDGSEYRVHFFVEDNAPEAVHWNYGEALRYLTFFYAALPSLNVNVRNFFTDSEPLLEMGPAAQHTDPFFRKLSQRPDDVSVASMSVEEAIHVLCAAAGAQYELALRNTGNQRTASVEYYLRVFASAETREEAEATPDRATVAPRVLDIPREAPFRTLAGRSDQDIAQGNKAIQAQLTIDRRVINAPIVLGGHKLFEVTLLLRPGWWPNLAHKLDFEDGPTQAQRDTAIAYWEDQFGEPEDDETGIPKSFYHGKHPLHYFFADVGRLWIFPDDHRWVNSDGTSRYERYGWPKELYDPLVAAAVDAHRPLILTDPAVGGAIVEAADWLPRRRRFTDTIGRLFQSADRAPLVKVNFTKGLTHQTALANANWVKFAGQVHLDPRRCAMSIKEDNIWSSPAMLADPTDDTSGILQAYIEGHLFLAVTCTIAGDSRLKQLPLPTPTFFRTRAAVMDTGFERFRYANRRDQNSNLDSQGRDADREFESVDDRLALEDYAEEQARIAAGDKVSGSIDIFFVDTSYRLGDTFSGCAGLGIEFSRYPAIVSIEHTNQPQAGQRTVLHLTDLRHSPEVGSE